MLQSETNFSINELAALEKSFHKLSAETDDVPNSIKREQMHAALKDAGMTVTDPALLDRIFDVLDKGETGSVDFREFVVGLSAFSRGSIKDRLEFSWKLYDLKGNQQISKEEMLTVLRAMRKTVNYSVAYKEGTEPVDPSKTDEELVAFVDKVFKEHSGGDDLLTKKQYVEAVVAHPFLITYIGN